MSKQILLICWDFPPNKGIGGRRWAKFAKSLAGQGYNVHVIKSTALKNNLDSPWLKDVKSEKIKTYELETFWAVKWLHDYSSPFSFLKIRIAALYLKTFFKGTIFDKATGNEQQFLELAKNLVDKNNIKNVIVTGAPFNLIYYSALLKRERPDLNVIADYRDPWINSVNYGMNFLDNKRKKQEEEKQNLVFENIDMITAPNQFLLEQIKETYTGDKKKLPELAVLSHIFDPEDVLIPEKLNKETNKFKLVYAGALYTDSEKYLNLLFNALAKFKKEYPEINIELDIYTEHNSSVIPDKEIKKCIKFLKPVGDNIFSIISNYNMMLILLTGHNKDFKTTKFFEFLPYKIPYLYVGPKGFVSESIEKDELGYLINKDDDMINVYKSLCENAGQLKGFDQINDHSLDNVTKNLTEKFIN